MMNSFISAARPEGTRSVLYRTRYRGEGFKKREENDENAARETDARYGSETPGHGLQKKHRGKRIYSGFPTVFPASRIVKRSVTDRRITAISLRESYTLNSHILLHISS
jgi:hypothetical protein